VHLLVVGVRGICSHWYLACYKSDMVEEVSSFLLLTGCLTLGRSCHLAIDLLGLIVCIGQRLG
jgi:hypothetical protein